MLIKQALLSAALVALLSLAGADHALAQSDETVAAGGAAAMGADGTATGVRGLAVGGSGGEDATLAFGVGNEVASAHLDAAVSGLALAVDPNGENGASVRTGSIASNAVTSMSGANRVGLNTGIANQGRALAIAAQTSFGD